MSEQHTDPESIIERRINWYISATGVLALALSGLVAFVEFRVGHGAINWTMFVIMSVLLIVTETQSSTWMRFGDGGVVTASWTFTFALMLLGSPLGAIAVMAAATIAADLVDRKELRKIVFNTAQISLSLAIGALTLFAFGVHGPVFVNGSTPTAWGVGVIVSGALVFGTNGIVLCRLLATVEKASFMTMMRESFALSMSADAAMLAMAPILVITTQNSMLMLPLMGSATFFVFQTARQAIQRAHEANHDPLTQLMNRRAFSGELDDFVQSAVTTGRTAGLFILDLDRFKEINDRLGHRTGDHVLQAFAERLLATAPTDAVVARLGGDEFAVLLQSMTPDEVNDCAHALHTSLDEPLIIDGFPISAGTSIGVSHYPAHGSTPSELLHAADVAMYRAKRFRTGVEQFEALASTQQRGRVTLLADIAGAIERNEFELSYQTQIDVTSGNVHAVEALLRWNHPTAGRIPPADFVSLAEQTDLIGPLTMFVIEQAVIDARLLPEHIRVAVNVSARNLQDRHFASATLELLRTHSFPAHRLEIEITESAIALDPECTVTALEEFRSAGVLVAIDDFGTGYSSFATLREITVDRIKIDRSFVTDIDISTRDQQIVNHLIELAHDLGLTVVAEGVESVRVLDLLRTFGCDVAQGYVIARPASIEGVAQQITTGTEPARSVTRPDLVVQS